MIAFARLLPYFNNNNDAITMSSSVMDDHFEKFLNLLIKAGWDIQKNNDKAIMTMDSSLIEGNRS